MRTEIEILGSLISFANSTEEIRAVILNGSRANPNIPSDPFSDYDVVFCVRDTSLFINNTHWMDYFGPRIIVQHNIINQDNVSRHIFLMLFTDGIRIDVTFFPVRHASMLQEDSLKKTILDKDKKFQNFQPADDSSYRIKKPSRNVFDETLNEFWFCSTNVAKGIRRKELCYASQMYSIVVHPCLVRVMEWHAGIMNNWKINTGKFGRFLQNYFSESDWKQFERTFPDSDYEKIWDSLIMSCELIRKYGTSLAQQLGYIYPFDDDSGVTEYLRFVRICDSQ